MIKFVKNNPDIIVHIKKEQQGYSYVYEGITKLGLNNTNNENLIVWSYILVIDYIKKYFNSIKIKYYFVYE